MLTYADVCLRMLLRHGLSRVLSLPKAEDVHETSICKSYRVAQGIVHNPKNDKRTTQGVFHVVDGGLPISGDKKVLTRAKVKLCIQLTKPLAGGLSISGHTEVWPNIALNSSLA